MTPVIISCESGECVATTRALFTEYGITLEYYLRLQDFARELADLPGSYAAARGGKLLLAYLADDAASDAAIGCIALRRRDAETCEMKRLYVRPAGRGHGVGRALISALIAEARWLDYARMVLDTLPGRMDAAVRLYSSFGFREIAPYYDNALPETLCMELRLH